MRDSTRIPKIIKSLEDLWTKYPDLRLGQLICNVCPADPTLYYIEDEELIKRLTDFYERLAKN